MTRIFICKWMIIAFFFTTMPSINAQIVNVANAVNKDSELGFTGQAGASWERRQGNTDLSVAKGDVVFRYRWEKDTIILIGSRERSTEANEVFSDSAFGHVRYRRLLTTLFDWEYFLQFDDNEFRNLEYRFVAGTGPRCKVVNSPENILYAGFAYMHEEEKYDDETKNSVKYRQRMSIFWYYEHALEDRLSFTSSAYYQPLIHEFDDFRILANAGLRFNLSSLVNYQFGFNYFRDTDPTAGVKPVDSKFMNSLAVEW